ncbi:MAG: cytochrome c1 [Pseudomonadota bacterium]
MKRLTTTLAALALSTSAAFAAGGAGDVTNYQFSFDGMFGTFDQNQLQRGLKVYTEICAGCHGLKYVPFRTLADEGGVGFSEEEMRAYTEQFEVYALDPEFGEYDYRTATPTDNFPEVLSANAPDLSMMAKARAGFHGPANLGINQFLYGMGGPEYIASLLSGYTGEEKEQAGTVLYENTAYPGGWISMAPPLWGEDTDFDDGAPNDLESISQDVAAFLMWTAEPKLAARKQMGFTAVVMLAVLSVLLYLTNKRIWAPIKNGRSRETA